LAAGLDSLGAGCALLDRTANDVPSEPFDDLVRTLRRAERACDAARSASADLAL
jgi:hypothetical protein